MKKFLLSVIVTLSLVLPAFAVTELTDQMFEKIVQSSIAKKKTIVIMFYADWCVACKKMSPMLDKAEKSFKNKVTFYRVNIDKSPRISETLTAVPTLLFINGKTKEVRMRTGLPPSQKVLEDSIKEVSK